VNIAVVGEFLLWVFAGVVLSLLVIYCQNRVENVWRQEMAYRIVEYVDSYGKIYHVQRKAFGIWWPAVDTFRMLESAQEFARKKEHQHSHRPRVVTTEHQAPCRSPQCKCEPCKTHREYQDVASGRAWKLYHDLREVVKELDDPAERYRPFL
jgi:hypothetical protein